MNRGRIRALIIKELLTLLRDPRGRMILFGPPLMQLLIFATAATMEVRNVDLVVYNQDQGIVSTELIQRIKAATPTIREVRQVKLRTELHEAIEQQKAIGGIIFAPDFSRRVANHESAKAQIILDGRKSNTSQIVYFYLNEIAGRLNIELSTSTINEGAAIQTVPAFRYNPNLVFRWFMVPNLVASIAMLICVIITALSVAREREIGTFDQLLVSPLQAHEILIGKVVPPILIGFAQLIFFIIAAVLIYSVPLRGSLILLFFSAIFFLLSVAGIGLFISSLARTQQQGILGAFVFLVPAMLLSGFATPIENMPDWLQPLTLANPLRYFLLVVRGIFLKGSSFMDIASLTWPMAIIALSQKAAIMNNCTFFFSTDTPCAEK